jgi:hypothetical protein
MIFQKIIALILLILGILEIVESIRTFIDPSPDIEHDSVLSKRLLSPYTRYWIGRYSAGLHGMAAGIGFLVLAAIFYWVRW